MLDDEKPTANFLKMESSKAGYSEIEKIKVKNPGFNEELPEDATDKKYFEITDSTLIRTEMHTTFKEIYKKTSTTHPSALEDYLNSYGDGEPLAELNRRRINKQDSLKMEGLLSLQNLHTHSLK